MSDSMAKQRVLKNYLEDLLNEDSDVYEVARSEEYVEIESNRGTVKIKPMVNVDR